MEDYFAKHEQIDRRRGTMVILDVCLHNIYAFKNFHMNLTYPKKIVDSSITEEHLVGRPNFRYKKVNIIMGANASGKTTFGRALMKIFNFLDKKNYRFVTDVIGDRKQEASFAVDMACGYNMFYRISCKISPCQGDKYTVDNINLAIQKTKILSRDNYEPCVKRIEETPYEPEANYIEELERVGALDWLFMYPDEGTTLRYHQNEEQFCQILEGILKALDPSIREVKESTDVENTYVIRLQDKAIILQDGEAFDSKYLSSGTKAGVEIAEMVSSMKHAQCGFYYCDEKFSYIHSDLEKAILSLMIDSLRANNQLFFTSHNTEILDLDLPKHTFTFLRKDITDEEHPISCITASEVLKRNTDSLKNAVENDMFACAPAVDLVYAIADL